MDPRMDTGLIVPRDPTKVVTAEEMNNRKLSDAERLALLDHLFNRAVCQFAFFTIRCVQISYPFLLDALD